MAAFGYKNPFAGKTFKFSDAFGVSPTTPGQSAESYFDDDTYGGNRRTANQARGRRIAQALGMSLTDQQIESLGEAASQFKGLRNTANLAQGQPAASVTNQSALDEGFNSFLQSGDILGSTGLGGANAGTMLGQFMANAGAAQAAGDQTAYGAYSRPGNIAGLLNVAGRTMGGSGLDIYDRGIREMLDTYAEGGDPYGQAATGIGRYFGQVVPANYVPVTQTGTNLPPVTTTPPAGDVTPPIPPTTTGTNLPPVTTTPPAGDVTPPIPPTTMTTPDQFQSAPSTPSDTGFNQVSGGSSGTSFGSATNDNPIGFYGDMTASNPMIVNSFQQFTGKQPNRFDLDYWNRKIGEIGADAVHQAIANSAPAQAYRILGRPVPDFSGPDDIQGIGAVYDYLAEAGLRPSLPREQWIAQFIQNVIRPAMVTR